MGVNSGYIKSLPGILRIVELVCPSCLHPD